jgi:hypothetical protein
MDAECQTIRQRLDGESPTALQGKDARRFCSVLVVIDGGLWSAAEDVWVAVLAVRRKNGEPPASRSARLSVLTIALLAS